VINHLVLGFGGDRFQSGLLPDCAELWEFDWSHRCACGVMNFYSVWCLGVIAFFCCVLVHVGRGHVRCG